MKVEELPHWLAKDIIQLLDSDELMDEIDNNLIDFPEGMDPESEEGQRHYDQQFAHLTRQIHLAALGEVLKRLAGPEVPNP